MSETRPEPVAPQACVTEQPFLTQTTFTLPGDGEDNANGFVGPICCTGETGRVMTSCGYPVGFFHYLFWDDQDEQTGEPFPAPVARLDITGSKDVLDPRAPHAEDAVHFSADADEVGSAKTVVVGDLVYTLTLQAGEKRVSDGVNRFVGNLVVGYVIELTAQAKARLSLPGATHLPYCGTGACDARDGTDFSCDVPACDACRLELPERWRGTSCVDSVGLNIVYTYGSNSNFDPIDSGEDCNNSAVYVDEARDAVHLCPQFCEEALSFAEKIRIWSECP